MKTRPIASLTLRAQRDASDPRASAWVSAHAGSGKTHVLAQRVMRLLLTGAPPSRILCLTFTKAAAANMSARIFDRLSRWAVLNDSELTQEIEEISGEPPTLDTLDFARRLFARAVETPGGLKIQTIHAFCEKLLHAFPFESNTPAGFRVVDDVTRAELLDLTMHRTLEDAVRDRGDLYLAMERVASEASGSKFEDLCRQLLSQRDALTEFADIEAYADRVRRALGLREGETLAQIEGEIIDGGERPESWRALVDTLRLGSSNDYELASHLESALALAPHADCIEAYLSVFFTTKREPRGLGKTKIITASLAKRNPGLLERMEGERDRLTTLVERRKSAMAAERSLALACLGGAILTEYTRAKRRRNMLDYEDLIERAGRLLNRASASWVLYKLDSQIDHILLDEAQDTSAAQWEILVAIAQEFCAGAGARRVERSFFAVGDEKQSIFSFQGAAPEKFDAMRRDFERRFGAVERSFHSVRLTQSFRSAPGVLEAVDAVFESVEDRRGLSFDHDEPAPKHEAWKIDVNALVEIWEPIRAEGSPEPGDWRQPLDYVEINDPGERLAGKVARKIKALLAPESGETVEDGSELRLVEAGDILILVRKRGAFFEAMIRALKSENIPVAGADRLDLVNHIAVNDLVALGHAMLLVDDDLTLATVLKSPIIGLDDDDLIAIAPRREGSLYEALARSDAPRHREVLRWIEEWRCEAIAQPPFEFYSQVLGPDGARGRLVARLGPEALDAIDEFLRLALAFEREHSPSLARFLEMIERLDLSIKRDMEAAGGAVRVMTVHAAKGLEAKIVFFPDTFGAPAGRHDPDLFKIGDSDGSVLIWSTKAVSDPAPVLAARERHRAAEWEEHQRLLYVALTRAEERLYVAGYCGQREPAAGCWYQTIRAALESKCETLSDPLEPGLTILRRGNIALRRDLASRARVEPFSEPPPSLSPAPHEDAPQPPMRPSSSLAGADALAFAEALRPTREEAERLLIGRLTHALLQHLPNCAAPRRAEAAKRFLALRGVALDDVRRELIARSALAVVADPRFASLFGPQSAAEVDIVATLDGGVSVVGRIDRLAETDTEVLIVDFKGGRPTKALALEHLRQLALYRYAVAPLYPGKRLRCFLIWTQDASVVQADDAAIEQAFAQAVTTARNG